MDPKPLDHYKTVVCKDIYAKWHMESPDVWKTPSVKAAFMDIKEFLATRVAADPVKSCLELDMELMDILEKHRGPGEMAGYQAIFVALLLECLDAKQHDDHARKPSVLLTHGYKCQLLSYLQAQLLGENTIDALLALHRNSLERDRVLGFFGVL